MVTEEQVLEQTALVERIARAVLRRLPPGYEFDDLVQAGWLGVLEAAQWYDAAAGVSFRAFARHRIRGAMLDAVRRSYKEHRHSVITEHLPARGPSLEELVAARELLGELSERERRLVEMRYWGGAGLSAIGAALAVTPQRVIQIRKSVIMRLRALAAA